MHFIWIGNPDNRRCINFILEIEKLKVHRYTIISHKQLLSQLVNWDTIITTDTIIKIDSTGEEEEVRKQLIFLGALTQNLPIESNIIDFGRIVYQAEWYRGFTIYLEKLKQSLQPYKVHMMNKVDDILVMFDKVKTQELLEYHKIPTPTSYSAIKSFEELIELMTEKKMFQVFIKPAHSSSASGIIAFRWKNSKMQAIAPIQIIEANSEIILYNSLKVYTYKDETIIKKLITTILSNRALVQQWIPKARYKNKSFDFRVLVINKKARHIVARMSFSPITNLHLGNERGNIEEIKSLIGQPKYQELITLAEKTATCFPDSLYMGIDILVSSGLKNFKVLEVNAFGDLLPNLIDQGETVYQAQIQTAIQKWQ
ncbi:STM4014 family protein [Flavobacterium oreochromis]|uniref:STM4014 family protein n=1 Tax=Flavobacterium oreochromis TaxID=2906078 RepID=A0ABW8PBT4_9FLAO|nr:hypothetical protein BWK58_10005 [Flavobacterium columnare]